MKTSRKRLLLSIGTCLAAGVAGWLYTAQSVAWWYPLLNKPAITPPAWVFGPVWAFLYSLMGYSLYLVWNKGLKKRGVSDAVALFGVQLILNVTWSYLFFGLRNPRLAFFEIAVLWVVILLTYTRFHKISAPAGRLLLPYLIWTGYAGVLNLFIVLMN